MHYDNFFQVNSLKVWPSYQHKCFEHQQCSRCWHAKSTKIISMDTALWSCQNRRQGNSRRKVTRTKGKVHAQSCWVSEKETQKKLPRKADIGRALEGQIFTVDLFSSEGRKKILSKGNSKEQKSTQSQEVQGIMPATQQQTRKNSRNISVDQ